MQELVISVPRINANEDEVKLVEVIVKQGDRITSGQHVLTLESTKAASEVFAEHEGILVAVLAEIGTTLEVGAPLYSIAVAGRQAVQVPAARQARRASSTTAKARKRARELGLDPATIQSVDGRITADVVETYAATNASRSTERPSANPTATGGLNAVLIGAGGHAGTILDALQGSGIAIIGAVDAAKNKGEKLLGDVKVIGDLSMLKQLRRDGVSIAFIGIGGAENSLARTLAYQTCKELAFIMPIVRAPQSYIASNARIGEASVVLSGAVIGPNVSVGRNTIINHNATVCHDSTIGDHCHLAPGATIAGGCEIGDSSVIGMCATVLYGVKIGKSCLVHNLASVISHLPDGKMQLRDGAIRPND